MEVTIVSLLELMEERRFFNVYEYDLVIFNWCVLDGAVMYESDRTQTIVRFYDSHFRKFVQNGGVLLFECQAKRWHPEQSAYDTLLPRQLRVAVNDSPATDTKVCIAGSYRDHPLVFGLASVCDSVKHGADDWFPEYSTSHYSLAKLQPGKLYSGTFRRWNPDWIPLLESPDRRQPVLLVKTEGQGLWIASTMFIAASAAPELIDRLIHAPHHLSPIYDYHNRHLARRRRHAFTAAMILVTVGFSIIAVLRFHVLGLEIPYASTIFGSVVIGVGVMILTSVAWKIGASLLRKVRLAVNRW